MQLMKPSALSNCEADDDRNVMFEFDTNTIIKRTDDSIVNEEDEQSYSSLSSFSISSQLVMILIFFFSQKEMKI